MAERNKEKVIDSKVNDLAGIKELGDDSKMAETVMEIQFKEVPDKIILKRGNQESDVIIYTKPSNKDGFIDDERLDASEDSKQPCEEVLNEEGPKKPTEAERKKAWKALFYLIFLVVVSVWWLDSLYDRLGI